mmetsp:Transcript_60180/g.97440  ORF Transcript_60180/g.97440 Transcript_60180/m.97440 type:complete len:89 (+) Transcript_60180:172-438(+)
MVKTLPSSGGASVLSTSSWASTAVAAVCAFLLSLLVAWMTEVNSCEVAHSLGFEAESVAAGAEAMQVLVVFGVAGAAGKVASNGFSLF